MKRGGDLNVVVVSYRSSAELPPCLASLRRDAAATRVVVVDNASDDGSVQVARAAGGAAVEILALDRNTGFAGGCNRGFAAVPAEVPYLAFMNPDVVVEPGCLERCVEVLEQRPEVAGVAPRLMRPDGATVDSVGQVLDRRTLEVRDRGYGQPLVQGLLEPRQVLAACGALAVYRRAALEAVAEAGGPWAGHYFCFWEDLELGWRLTNRGFRVLAAPHAVAVHGRGAGAEPGQGRLRWRRPPELEACVLSNRWMTLIRHLHSADLVRRLPLLLAFDLGVTVLGVARRPRLLPHLRRRLPLVYRELGRREHLPRKRLSELPW
jgi:hypothetical protein